MTQPAVQLALLDPPDPLPRGGSRGARRPRRAGRYEPLAPEETAAMGRALLAKLRGQELSAAQRALLAGAEGPSPADRRAPTPVVEASETLLTLGRGEDAELRVRWRRYRGSSPFLDLRRFERGEHGELRPTRRGVTIRGHEVERLLEALLELQARPEG